MIPPEELGRQAVAALRGYAYQVWTSALAWARLQPGEILLLEVADDYGTISSEVLALTQVKDTAASGSVTLANRGVLDAINRLWRFKKANPDLKVSLTYLTTALIGHERSQRFPDGRPGLEYWRVAARDDADTTPLRRALSQSSLDADLVSWVQTTSDDILRAELLRPIRFAAAEPPLAEIETLLSEALAHLCATAGARGTDIQKLRNAMVIDVLRTATAADPEARHLSRADLIARIRESGLSDLPGLGHAGGLRVLDRVEATSLGTPAASRPAAERALALALSNGAAWLYGPSGIGKTALSRTLVGGSNRPWFSVDLRDMSAAEIARRLRAARQDLLTLDAFGGVVLDDLNVTPTGAIKRELMLLLEQVRREDARALITAYTPAPSSIQAELGLISDVIIASPRFTEDETAALVSQAGGDPARWAKAVHLFSGAGYPQLVAARVAALSAKGWPKQELVRMIDGASGDAVDDEKEGARRRLLDELPPSAASLLYRVSLIAGTFDRALALILAETSPAIAEAGAALDLLKGPWLEPMSNGRLRVSPLLSDAGIKVLSQPEQMAMHSAIATGLASRSTIDAVDLTPLILSAIRTGNHQGLQVIVHTALLKKLPDLVVARALYPLAFMRTDQPLVTDAPALNTMLRFAQIKVAALDNMAAVAQRSYQALLGETDDDPPGRALRTMAAFIMATNLEEMPATSWFPIIYNLAPDAIDRISELRDLAPEDADAGPPWDFAVQDLGAFLFTYRSHRLQGLSDLEALIDLLECAAPDRRSTLLAGVSSLGRLSENRQILIQSAWMAETKQGDFDALTTAERLAAIARRVALWPDDELRIEALCAQVVMLAEYAEQPDEGLRVVDDALSAAPGSDRFRRERVKILIQLKRFSEVAADAERLLSEASRRDAVEQVFAGRDIAIATAEAGDITKAITQFQSASATAASTRTLQSLGLRLEADVILLRWRNGERGEALRSALDLATRAEALDDVLNGENGPKLVRGLYMMAEVMMQDLTAPGWDATISIVGIASRPNDGAEDLPRPLLLAVWYRLAEVQYHLGLDVGADEALDVRRSKGKLVAFEVVRTRWASWRSVGAVDPFAAAVAISERARSIAWIRRQVTGIGDSKIAAEMFTLVEVLPWEGELNPADDEDVSSAVEVVLVSLAFATARGEAAWLESVAQATRDAGLSAIIRDLPKPDTPVDLERSGHAVLWSLRQIATTDHDTRDLFIATAHLSHWLGQLPAAAEIATILGPILESHWRRVALERRFSLSTPDLTAPAILEAAQTVGNPAGIARLLLAAKYAVRVSVPAETIATWRKIAA